MLQIAPPILPPGSYEIFESIKRAHSDQTNTEDLTFGPYSKLQ